MKRFPDKLVLQDAGMRGDSRVFILCSRFRFHSEFGTIEAPAGFMTDGASVPRVFWNILSPFGDYFGAAVIHDYLYSPMNHEFHRWEADDVFLDAMEAAGVPWIRRHVIHRAVRMFGWAAFKGKPKP